MNSKDGSGTTEIKERERKWLYKMINQQKASPSKKAKHIRKLAKVVEKEIFMIRTSET